MTSARIKIPISEQIEEAERYRNGLQGFVENGVEPKEGPSAAVRLHRAEAILLTLHAWAAFAAGDNQPNTTNEGKNGTSRPQA